MKKFLRGFYRRAPPAQALIPVIDLARESQDGDARLRTIEKRFDEIQRHFWELQHSVHVLREELVSGKGEFAKAAREACRAEIDIFRQDFETTYQDVYGALGAKFRRRIIAGVGDSLVDRFGNAEKARRDGSERSELK
jgi:hypothetical protein